MQIDETHTSGKMRNRISQTFLCCGSGFILLATSLEGSDIPIQYRSEPGGLWRGNRRLAMGQKLAVSIGFGTLLH